MISKTKNALIAVLMCALIGSGIYIAWGEYTSVKQALADQIDTNKSLNNEIEGLRDKMRRDDENKSSQEDNQKKLDEAINSNVKEQEIARRKIEEIIRNLDKKYDQLPKTPETEKAKSMEFSLQRARGAWAIYCIHEKEDPVCK